MPPAPEQARGLWIEAVFLAETDFDYCRLIYDEPRRHSASNYGVTILPTLVAVLMRLGSDPSFAITAYHLLTIAFAAFVGAHVFRVISETSGVWAGLLVAGAMITTPLFNVQAEMLGMDMPLAACMMLMAIWLADEKFVRAGLAAMLAYATKPTGIVATLIAIGFVVVRLFWRRRTRVTIPEREGRQPLWRALTLYVGLLVVQMITDVMGSAVVVWLAPFFSSRNDPWFGTIAASLFLCPDVIVLLLISAAITAWLVFVVGRRSAHRATEHDGGPCYTEPFPYLGDRRRVFLVSVLVVACTLAATIPGRFHARYWTSMIPFLYLLLGLALFASPHRTAWPSLFFLTVIVVNLVNQNGVLFPSITELVGPVYDKLPHFRERSREYLTPQRNLIAAMHQIDRGVDHQVVLSNYPYGLFMGVPRVGYVTAPKQGYCMGLDSRFVQTFRPFDEHARFPPNKSLVCVWAAERMWRPPVPFEPGDRLVAGGPWPADLIAFEKRWQPLPESQAALDQWFSEAPWGGKTAAENLRLRTQAMLGFGRQAEAIRDLEKLATSARIDVQVRGVAYQLTRTIEQAKRAR